MTRKGFAATPCAGTPIVDMPSDRTFVTEIATGLGMCEGSDLDAVIRARPAEMSNLSSLQWDHLAQLRACAAFESEFDAGFENGRAFRAAPDALHGRRPRIIEWTGGWRAPGDEVVPSDLRVDHVYMVSCKYLSKILHNPSPARLVEGLLSHGSVDDLSDWYGRVAPCEYQELYDACVGGIDVQGLPTRAVDLVPAQRRTLKTALRSSWPPAAKAAYARLGAAVSRVTAELWSARLSARNAETVLWRLLRIGSAPYFILGSSRRGSMRLRIDTPWDWRESFRLASLEISSQEGGQPLVAWSARYVVKATDEERTVRGHAEIRWSHGRFGQPPEAKVYLDTPHEEVPGYHEL
jgi:hypothetical protein